MNIRGASRGDPKRNERTRGREVDRRLTATPPSSRTGRQRQSRGRHVPLRRRRQVPQMRGRWPPAVGKPRVHDSSNELAHVQLAARLDCYGFRMLALPCAACIRARSPVIFVAGTDKAIPALLQPQLAGHRTPVSATGSIFRARRARCVAAVGRHDPCDCNRLGFPIYALSPAHRHGERHLPPGKLRSLLLSQALLNIENARTPWRTSPTLSNSCDFGGSS